MKKNILIAILALMVVGGGGFAAGDKLSENNAKPDTTVEGTTVETANENAVAEASDENGASSVIEKVSSKIENLVTKKDTDTEKVVEVANKTEEPKAEVVKHTEKVTEAVKPAEKVTEAVTKVNKPDKPAEATTSSTAVIPRDKAKSVALNYAGLKAADVRELEIELDKEKGVLVYEVSFESGKYDYEYHIDAVTGAVKFSEKEAENTVKVTEPATEVNKPDKPVEATTSSTAVISREKAKSVALNHAGLKEADVRELEIELDKENGVYVYEVSFESGKYDYEYHIDAVTGAIKFSEKEPEAVGKVNKIETKAETTKNSAEKISREKAKSIALNHAGLKEADVRGLEIELDYDKGIHVYEVSFESGRYEYDYDIDAYSGVVKFSEKSFDD